MSRIWQALKNAERQRSASFLPESASVEGRQAAGCPQGNHTTSWVPVFVYGHATDGEPFHEEALALRVSGKEGLLALAVGVSYGQKLLLTDQRTEEEQVCRVVYVGPQYPGKNAVIIEFARAAAGLRHTGP